MATNRSLTDTPIYRFTNCIYRWFAVSMLWLLCSLPLVTIGAATAAAMGEFSNPVNDEDHQLVRDFFRRFGCSFFRATALWLGLLALAALLTLDVCFYRAAIQLHGHLLDVMALVFGNVLLGFLRFGCFEAGKCRESGFFSFFRGTGRRMLLCLPAWTIMIGIDLVCVTTLIKIPSFCFLVVLLPGFLAQVHCRLICDFSDRFHKKPEKEAGSGNSR